MNSSGIIIFDGCCNLCAALVDFLARHDREAAFEFVPAQSPRGRKLQSRLGINALESQSLILIKNGIAFYRSEAVLEIVSDLKGIWKIAALLKIIPLRLRDPLYLLVAARRYHWWGRREGCRSGLVGSFSKPVGRTESS